MLKAQFTYDLDKTQSDLNIDDFNPAENYCDESNITLITDPDHIYSHIPEFTTTNIITRLTDNFTFKSAPSSRIENNSFEESFRLTKCCTIKYNDYLRNNGKNSTLVDQVLDVILGTVEYLADQKRQLIL